MAGPLTRRRGVLALAAALGLSLIAVIAPGLAHGGATGRKQAANPTNPLAGHRQFLNCETLTSPNQGFNPWLRVHQATGKTRAALLRLAHVPTVWSFAGTSERDIGKRMERYMAEVDHPAIGGSDCSAPLSYSDREWEKPVPADDPRRAYIGEYPILAIRSLDYASCKGGVGNTGTDYRAFIDSFTKELGRTWSEPFPYGPDPKHHGYSDKRRPPDAYFRPYPQRAAAIILEPDFLALVGNGKGCVSPRAARTSVGLISYAVKTLTTLPNVAVYIDAGEDNWLGVRQAVSLLKRAGVAGARGFVLNATHTGWTKDNIRYGDEIARKLHRHYVINTAENAHGKLPRKYWFGPHCAKLPYGPPGYKGKRVAVCGDGHAASNKGGQNTNCNPPNAGLGAIPTTRTASKWADAYLYISRPGISSNAGNRCMRGPARNVWWTAQAVNEAERAVPRTAPWPPKPL
jgi:hypothetical protein